MKTTPIRSFLVLPVLLFVLFAGSVPAFAQPAGVPTSFKIGPLGDLTCLGTDEDACAYYDEVPTPKGVRYLVQGSYSRKPDASSVRLLGPADYVNSYFALLCDRDGDTLTPVFNFLEGMEKASDLHIYDLDADAVPEIIVTGIFDSRGSYAAVYRLTAADQPERIFLRRANTPNTDFESDHGRAFLIFQQRDSSGGGLLRNEVFRWNGQTFAPES